MSGYINRPSIRKQSWRILQLTPKKGRCINVLTCKKAIAYVYPKGRCLHYPLSTPNDNLLIYWDGPREIVDR
jgi:hypothetical protein